MKKLSVLLLLLAVMATSFMATQVFVDDADPPMTIEVVSDYDVADEIDLEVNNATFYYRGQAVVGPGDTEQQGYFTYLNKNQISFSICNQLLVNSNLISSANSTLHYSQIGYGVWI